MMTVMNRKDYSDKGMITVMIHRNQKASQLQRNHWNHNINIGINNIIIHGMNK